MLNIGKKRRKKRVLIFRRFEKQKYKKTKTKDSVRYISVTSWEKKILLFFFYEKREKKRTLQIRSKRKFSKREFPSSFFFL